VQWDKTMLHSTMHMNFFKRATKSIVRRPGKTIILLLLVFILGSVIAGAIAVNGAITNTDANLRRQMQPVLSIEFDQQEWARIELEYYGFDPDTFDWESIDPDDPTTHAPTPSPLRPSDIRAIGSLGYVNFYDFIARMELRSFELERYGGGWSGPGEPAWLNFRGSSSTDLVHIDQGFITLTQGTQFSEADLIPDGDRAAAIVSEGFANTNNLSLGSIFESYVLVMFPRVGEEGNYVDWSGNWGPDRYTADNIYAQIGMEFEIIGLFDIPLDDIDLNPDSQEYWDRMNNLSEIYVPNWALESIHLREIAAQRTVFDVLEDVEVPDWFMREPEVDEDAFQMWGIASVFVLEDPAYMDDFRMSAAELLPRAHRFVDLSNAFDDIASSMQTLQTVANWVLYVSIGATLLILSLLITLFLRDRRHEMGVYLALGEKKGKIITQILIEVLVTSVVAITFSIFAGTIISDTVSSNMLRNELMAAADEDPWMNWEWSIFDQIGIPSNDMSVDEMMAAFDISLSVQTISLFYVIGLSAVVLSTLVPVIYVVTLNPKKVLL